MEIHRCRSIAVFAVLLVALAVMPLRASEASPQNTIAVVASSWKYVYDGSSTYNPHRVEVMAEIKNVSGEYVKDVAVRATLLMAGGGEITSQTEDPVKVTLAPGESTFYFDTIYHASSFLTTDVRFAAFGDPAAPADHRYLLPDPAPSYLVSYVDGAWVTYFGEFINTSTLDWRAECELCRSPRLIGVYYEGNKPVEWEGSGAPYGHRAAQSKLAFRFQFQRVPNGNFKLFLAAEPMRAGDYATRWGVENLQWVVATVYGRREVQIKATVRNLSDVPAEPSIWIVGRDSQGQWLGWTYCSAWSDVQPNGILSCNEEITSGNMHKGEPDDVRSVEVLVSSSAITHTGPPTPTPTATATATATATPTSTPTATPILDERVYLPMALK